MVYSFYVCGKEILQIDTTNKARQVILPNYTHIIQINTLKKKTKCESPVWESEMWESGMCFVCLCLLCLLASVSIFGIIDSINNTLNMKIIKFSNNFT